MMQSNMKQIAIWSGYARSFFACYVGFWIFYDRIWPGVRDDVTALRISATGLKFGGMVHSNMKQIAE